MCTHVCRELYVVEVKNWSGAIELQPDGSWLQIRRNGTVQKHSNVVSVPQSLAFFILFKVKPQLERNSDFFTVGKSQL